MLHKMLVHVGIVTIGHSSALALKTIETFHSTEAKQEISYNDNKRNEKLLCVFVFI